MSEEKCRICTELRRAAMAAIRSSHEAFSLVLETVTSGEDSHLDTLMQSAAEHRNAKLGVIDAYVRHLQTHCHEEAAVLV